MYPGLIEIAEHLIARRPRLLSRLRTYRDAIDGEPQCPICWVEDELHAGLAADPFPDDPKRYVCTLHGNHVFGL